MTPGLIFIIILLVLIALVIFLDMKFDLLRDQSIVPSKKPFSYARSQLAWWTVIVMAAFLAVFITRGELLTFNSSALILLGISASTTVVARLTDISDDSSLPASSISQNYPGQNFFIDILSDNQGVSIHRLQTVIFNLTIGIWFIYQVMANLAPGSALGVNDILPVIEQNNLILMGLSSGTYAALKTTENKGRKKADSSTETGDESSDIPPVG
jgi:hypothetical protein